MLRGPIFTSVVHLFLPSPSTCTRELPPVQGNSGPRLTVGSATGWGSSPQAVQVLEEASAG